MLVVPPAPSLLHQPAPRQEIARGADCGPDHGRISGPQPGHELGRAPTRMLAPGGADYGRDFLRDPVRTMVRRPAPILQASAARLVEALQPLVAGLPAHVVTRAQLGHHVQPGSVIANESLSLLHG